MSFSTFTPNYYSRIVRTHANSLTDDNLYLFVADGLTTDAVSNSKPKTIYDEQQIVNQIIYGGRVKPANVVALCRRINWVSGKIFDKYDSLDPDLEDKDFYCITSQRRVYKCLSNANEKPSTVEPSSLDQMPTTYGDNYTWKYMYSITVEEMSTYSNAELMPVIENTETKEAAVPGTISDVDVVDGGNYTATHSGNILNVVNNKVFRVMDSASNVDDIYKDSAFYISSGPSESSIATITGYKSNSSGRFITVDSSMPDVTISSQYTIAPRVNIVGDGSGASAFAVIEGNTVDRVDMLTGGSNYTYATSTLVSNTAFSSDGALKTIIAPIKGHGSDVYNELFANYIMYNFELDNIMVDLPVEDITFSRVGLIRGLVTEADPTVDYDEDNFVNTATLEVATLFGNFEVGDLIESDTGGATKMKVVYANTTHITGVYQHASRFITNDRIINQNGITASVVSATTPDVKLISADVVAIVNTDTIKRDENSREIVQIIIKVK